MKVVFGVGNPGKEYELTRHNVGFQIIDKLCYPPARRPPSGWLRRTLAGEKVTMKLERDWWYGKAIVDGNKFFLIKPMSFVNECGRVALEVVHKFGIQLKNFIVVLDDFSLPLGKTRLRPRGSSGGHKGLESIIYHLESEAFPRLRIGIGPVVSEQVDFVLSRFKPTELKLLEPVIERAILGIQVFIKDGLNQAMEVCNINS